MQQRQEAGGGGAEAVVFRVLCPVDRIEAVTRLSVSGARIRFDSASASPFPSDRVVLISPLSFLNLAEAQAALLSVFERIVLPPSQSQLQSLSSSGGQAQAMCRLLSPSSQVGCILGKGGKIVERLRQETGAQIRVFNKEHAFPDFNGTPDELVNISGTFNAVKKALISISALLLDNARCGTTTVSGGPNVNMGPHVMGYNSTVSMPPPNCTTTQVLIPNQYLPFVTGDDGTDLSHIKQMSGVDLSVEDPKPGETTGKVIIYGTAQQTKTAQSLVHGLIFCGVFNSP